MSAERIAALERRLAVYCENRGLAIDAAGRVTDRTAAELLGRAQQTLANWRSAGIGPEYFRERPPMYALSALARFLSDRASQLTESSRDVPIRALGPGQNPREH